MNINKIKIIISIIIFIITINIFLPVHADSVDEILKQGNGFLEMGKTSTQATFNGKNLKDAIMNLYDKFWWAGLAIAAIIGTFLGIQFMTSGIEGKAKIKEALIPFVIGCVVIFGAFTIWRIAMGLFGQVEKEEANAGYVASNRNSTGTVFNTEGCGPGKHSYGKVSNHYCGKCNAFCEHKNLTQNGTAMVCSQCQESFPICGLPIQAGGRGQETTHDFGAGGRCEYCGTVCQHSWSYYNKDLHKCTAPNGCGTCENHDWVATGQTNHTCKCGRVEPHTLAYDGENDQYYCYYCKIKINQ